MIKKTHIFSVIIFAIVILIIESIFRFTFPVPEVTNFNRIDYSPMGISDTIKSLYDLANKSFIWTSTPDNASFRCDLNLYGFRDKNWDFKKQNDKIRIAFVGDSVIEGFLSDNYRTIPASFSRQAKQDRLPLESLNFGISGNWLPNYYIFISDLVRTFEIDAIVLLLSANDLPPQDYQKIWLRHQYVPKFANRFIPRLVTILNSLYKNEEIPTLWNKKPFPFFSPVPSSSNPWSDKCKKADFEKFVEPEIAHAMQRGQFNAFAVNEYDNYKQNLVKSFNIEIHLKELKEFTEEFNISLYLAYLPYKGQVSDHYLNYQKKFTKSKNLESLTGDKYQLHANLLSETCLKLSIPFLDLTSFLKEKEKSGKHLFWNYDEHLNPEGYDQTGKHIFLWWKTHFKP